MDKNYQYIEEKFKYINDLEHAVSMLSWDEDVMMPVGGAKARNESLVSLLRTIYQQLNDEELSTRLCKVDETLLDDWQKSNLRLIKKTVSNATILPEQLVADLTIAAKESTQAWRVMRGQNNWKDFAPLLTKTVNLVKEKAKIKAKHFKTSAYDALLDEFSPGITVAHIDPVFDELKLFLPQMIPNIIAQQEKQVRLPVEGDFPVDKQYALSCDLMRSIGFDFNHGRIDTSHHPFCGGVPLDIRITTRYKENDFLSSAMAVCHETGHAMYERALPKAYQSQPVGKALGMTVHESQSLLIEKQACGSVEFMQILAKYAQQHFGQNKALEVNNLWHIVTQVKPGLIRTEADEVTYPLHVILRYEIEKLLFNGEISVDDLPDIWQQKMKEYFDIDTKGNNRDGVMQDIHWSSGDFGYFPSYALGSLLAAQLFESVIKDNADILAAISQADFSPLMHWLGNNIHQYGSKYSFNELVAKATGKTLTANAYIEHIKRRYQA